MFFKKKSLLADQEHPDRRNPPGQDCRTLANSFSVQFKGAYVLFSSATSVSGKHFPADVWPRKYQYLNENSWPTRGGPIQFRGCVQKQDPLRSGRHPSFSSSLP